MAIEIPLPPLLLPDEGEGDTHNCLLCGKTLSNSDEPYLMEKAYKQAVKLKVRETLFSYTMCLPCAQDMTRQLSKESRQRINRYLQENIRPFSYMGKEEMNVRLNECAFTGKMVWQMSEFQIMALCKRGQLYIGDWNDDVSPPLIMSGDTADALQQQMSQKTKDELDKFMDTVSGLPPEWMEWFRKRPVFF